MDGLSPPAVSTAAEQEVAKNRDVKPAGDSDAANGGGKAGDHGGNQVDEANIADQKKKEPEEDAPPLPDDHPFPFRPPAPSLAGGVGWINTAAPIKLEDLKGKFVVLDFWTYCCINCMHILPELKKLEKKYPNEIVVIGVHSAKFDGEKDSQNIIDAVLRHEIEHPVVNDAEHAIWNRWQISGWPALRVVDPEGKLVAGNGGEITFEELDAFFTEAIAYYKKQGLLNEKPIRFDLESYKAGRTPLRYPGKLLADEKSRRLFIADSNHNRIVVARLDGKLIDTIGTGAIGAADGDFATARFDHPQGMALAGETLYVADTENHLLRKVDLKTKQVTTIAGVGRQARGPWPGPDNDGRFVGKPLETAINSPWALWVHQSDLYIAMAGPHQIWRMSLDGSQIGPYAGNGREDIVDGPLLPTRPGELGFSSFAQPSGLASDGTWLYVADSEGSSIRAVPLDREQDVKTIVGTSRMPGGRLFLFGDRDGRGLLKSDGNDFGFGPIDVRSTTGPLLQHALGVVHYEGKLYVADTYNNKIKVIDPQTGDCYTLVGTGQPGADNVQGTFDEPAGITAADGKLYVADTNNHLIRVIELRASETGTGRPKFPREVAQQLDPIQMRADEGHLRLGVDLQLPPGYKINPLGPMRYYVEATDETGPVDRAALGKTVRFQRRDSTFEIHLPVTVETGRETLKATVVFFYCQETEGGICKVGSVTWTIPLEISPDAEETLAALKYNVP